MIASEATCRATSPGAQARQKPCGVSPDGFRSQSWSDTASPRCGLRYEKPGVGLTSPTHSYAASRPSWKGSAGGVSGELAGGGLQAAEQALEQGDLLRREAR